MEYATLALGVLLAVDRPARAVPVTGRRAGASSSCAAARWCTNCRSRRPATPRPACSTPAPGATRPSGNWCAPSGSTPRSPCSCSTSTTSRTSTTRTATRPATRRSRRSPTASVMRCAATTPSAASAARSSSRCSPTSTPCRRRKVASRLLRAHPHAAPGPRGLDHRLDRRRASAARTRTALDDLISVADQALYVAKNSGRDRVHTMLAVLDPSPRSTPGRRVDEPIIDF